jgi:DNA-binding winged helix-turn-helix (wHTH) protein
MRLSFAECLFDGPARVVTRDGQPVDLSPKAFELLAALLERRPEVLSKNELHDRLWPDVHVSHTALPRVVSELRKALGDDPNEPRFVRNVHGFGYAFCGEATSLSGPHVLSPLGPTGNQLCWGLRQIDLPAGETLIGRSLECRVRIDSPRVSRHHARVCCAGSEVTLADLGSKNGTYWRGQRIEAPVVLQDGDEIGVGNEVLIYRTANAQRTTETDLG